jgi:hypothetical protein
MERIKPTLPKPTATTARSEREELMQKFLNRINPSRDAMRLKPLTAASFNKLVEGWGTTSNLYWLYGECDRARNFSKMFWYKIRQSKLPESKARNIV